MDLFLIFTVFLSIYLNSFHELLLISDTCGSPDSSKTIHAAAPARPADVIAERVMMPGQQKRDLSDSRPGILLCSVILYLKVSLLCHIYSLPLIFQAAFIIKSLYGRNVNENGKKVYLLFTWRGTQRSLQKSHDPDIQKSDLFGALSGCHKNSAYILFLCLLLPDI